MSVFIRHGAESLFLVFGLFLGFFFLIELLLCHYFLCSCFDNTKKLKKPQTCSSPGNISQLHFLSSRKAWWAQSDGTHTAMWGTLCHWQIHSLKIRTSIESHESELKRNTNVLGCIWEKRCRKLYLWGSEVWEAEREVKGSKSRMLFLLLCLAWPMTLQKSLLFASLQLWCVLCSAATFGHHPHSYHINFLIIWNFLSSGQLHRKSTRLKHTHTKISFQFTSK